MANKTPLPAPGNPTAPRGDIYLAQNKEKPSIKDDQDAAVRALDKLIKPDDAAAEKPVLGEREWRAKDGNTQIGTFLRLSKDGKAVILKTNEDGKNKRIQLDELTADDQALVKGLQALPKNVTLDTFGLMEKNQQPWREAVVRDFGRLDELPHGEQLLKDIRRNSNGIIITPRAVGDDNRTKYSPKNGGSSDVKIFYSPTDRTGDIVDRGRGDRDRPPYIALGKELSTGVMAAKTSPDKLPTQLEEELRSARIENLLRDEHNKNLKPGEKSLPHRDLPM